MVVFHFLVHKTTNQTFYKSLSLSNKTCHFSAMTLLVASSL